MLLGSQSLVLASADKKHWQDKDYIENSFYDIALQSEYEQISPVVKKWTEPLNVWFSSSAGDIDFQRRILVMHLIHLADIINLPLSFVEQQKDANVRVFFASNAALESIVESEMSEVALVALPQSVCLGQIHFNKSSEITRGTVVIPVERVRAEGKFVPCVVEELTQMLGLVNDSETVFPTVFSDMTEDALLTGLDYILLKLLYSDSAPLGRTSTQISPSVKKQLLAWEQSGLIQEAQAVISKSPLHMQLAPK